MPPYAPFKSFGPDRATWPSRELYLKTMEGFVRRSLTDPRLSTQDALARWYSLPNHIGQEQFAEILKSSKAPAKFFLSELQVLVKRHNGIASRVKKVPVPIPRKKPYKNLAILPKRSVRKSRRKQ